MTEPILDEQQLQLARQQLEDAIHLIAGRQRLTVDRDSDDSDILAELDADYQRRREAILRDDDCDPDRCTALADLQRRHEEAIVAATATTSWTPSRYQQLDAALSGPRLGRGGTNNEPQPPIWIDGVDLRAKIIRTLTEWRTTWQTGGLYPTAMLHALADHRWRPQDVPAMQTITHTCTRWAAEIDALFDPPRKITIAAACPACGQSTVYRPDETGEPVRQAALAVDYQRGATCLNCREHWPPERFLLLEQVLRGDTTTTSDAG